MRMKTILPFKPVIFRLFCIAGITVAGSSLAEAAGVELTYPGAPLDENGLLFPQGSLSDNTVSITGGSIPGNAYGAKTTDGDTIRNRISMTGGSVLHLLGAYSATGTVEYNSVILGGGTVARNVYGGESGSGNAQYNSITMTGGSAQWLQGAYSNSGNVTGNEVLISGGTLSGGVNGGQTAGGDAISNSVRLGNATATWLNGGYSSTGNASGNRVIITSGGVNNNAFGGFVESGTGNACNNLFIMYGGEVGLNGEIPGVGHGIMGGRASEGNASGNRVIFLGGHTGFIDGGTSSNGGAASGNHVLILGGNIDGSVTGGMSFQGSSSGNVVEIRGGTVGGYIYGGRADKGTASNNTVILEGNFNLNGVFGGWDAYASSPGATAMDVTTGNVLILENFQGSATNVGNFEHYVFRLSSWNENGGPMLTISNGTSSTAPSATDLSGSTIRVEITGVSPGSPGPAVGDTISLIRNNMGLITNGVILKTPFVSFKRGIAMLYDATVSVGNTSIDATVTSSRLNPQLKSLSEGRAAAMALNNQGADLAAGLGISRAAMAAMQGGSPSGMETFLAMEGSHSNYATGSRVEQDGYAVLAGVSAGFSKNRSVVLGGFMESGWGSYTAHNAFADAPFVRASGDTSYYGGGLLARWDLTDNGLRGIALEASFRAGRLDSDYRSGDLVDGAGNPSAYNLSSPYYGGHAGAALTRELDRKMNMEAYGRFLWTRQDGDHATVSGDHIRFRDMNSSWLQGGARFHYEMTQTIRPYAGAAYEWQCNGTARASTYGQDIAAPTLRGGTGMAELGVIFQPVAGKPMFVDLGVKGYAGKREGVSGSLQFRAAF